MPAQNHGPTLTPIKTIEIEQDSRHWPTRMPATNRHHRHLAREPATSATNFQSKVVSLAGKPTTREGKQGNQGNQHPTFTPAAEM